MRSVYPPGPIAYRGLRSIRRVCYTKSMAKMTEAQRRAILNQHRSASKGAALIANARTIAVLVREGWAHLSPNERMTRPRSAYVTRAGLIAAGVNMDKLCAQARADWTVRDDDPRDDAVREEARRYRMRGGRGDVRLWAVDICRGAAHAEALREDEARDDFDRWLALS
jgi:hypothetical protein